MNFYKQLTSLALLLLHTRILVQNRVQKFVMRGISVPASTTELSAFVEVTAIELAYAGVVTGANGRLVVVLVPLLLST